MTLLLAAWCNDLNRTQYTILSNPATLVALRRTLGPVLDTKQTLGGTTDDFTIAAGARMIVGTILGASSNGTSNMMLQLGVSAAPETSGYISSALESNSGGNNGADSTAGFLLTGVNGSAANVYYGQFVLAMMESSSNTWSCTSTLNRTGPTINTGSGTKPLAGVLDLLRFTYVNGTDSSDAGTMNIMTFF